MSSDPGEVVALLRELVALLKRIEGPGIGASRRALAAIDCLPATTSRQNAVIARHLPAALNVLRDTEPRLASTLADASPHLFWQTYDDYPVAEIGQGFGGSHAFCTLLGESGGSWPAPGIDIGLFLMAPGLLYRDHAHVSPELYLPLTGPHGWRFLPDDPFEWRNAFEPVWNAPDAPHATLVGEVPFLCLYAWLDHPQAIARIVPATDWSRYEP